MVAVMGYVFASVYNFHTPLSSKVELSIQRDCNLSFKFLVVGLLAFFLFCGVTSTPVFVPIGVYLVFLLCCAVVCLGFWWNYYVFW
jgi:hypothetical protein